MSSAVETHITGRRKASQILDRERLGDLFVFLRDKSDKERKMADDPETGAHHDLTAKLLDTTFLRIIDALNTQTPQPSLENTTLTLDQFQAAFSTAWKETVGADTPPDSKTWVLLEKQFRHLAASTDIRTIIEHL